jgi:putative membrane protein insertion efficiency factor
MLGGTGEPPFPMCPCWLCCGDFDLLYMLGVCQDVVIPAALAALGTVAQHPLIFLREWGSGRLGLAGLATGLIRRYRDDVSAYLPPRCPFTPSCSRYAMVALERFGFWRGMALTLRRLYRCRSTVVWGTPNPVPETSPA